MKSHSAVAFSLALALFFGGCAETTTSTVTWGEPAGPGNWVLYGHVESVREVIEHDRGDPAGGAVAGAVIGGILGTALGGRGFGTFVGAAEGAAIGASSSQGGYVGRAFQVFVRFDDGSLRTFVYHDQLPFRPGQYVVWTAQGLAPR